MKFLNNHKIRRFAFGFRNFFVLLAFAYSCSPMGVLGPNENHRYFSNPKKIVVIQIPGLSNELIGLHRLSFQDAKYQSNWESAECLGTAWSYDLFNLRSPARHSTLISLLSTPNTDAPYCEMTSQVPIWAPFVAMGHQVTMYERYVPEEDSLENFLKCEENILDLSRVTYFSSQKKAPSGKEIFHFQKSENLSKGKVYRDQSCQGDGCFAQLDQNIEFILNNTIANNKNFYFILIRDWSLLNLLEKKRYTDLYNELGNWEKALRILLEKVITDLGDATIIVTGNNSIPIELPQQGKDWGTITKSGSGIIVHRSSTQTPIWVWGARAENFCGYQDLSMIARKLL